jgi:GTP cyclohydrolase II
LKSDLFFETTDSVKLPTPYGDLKLKLYVDAKEQKEHLALFKGEDFGGNETLVRIHSECLTGDIFSSQRCDCGEQLHKSLELIGSATHGVLIYLRQEGRGIGLAKKLKAYKLQEEGHDTVDANILLGHQADERDYTIAAHILEDLGITDIQLVTNNPDKVKAMEEHGLHVARMPSPVTVTEHNKDYLKVKQTKLSHLLKI